jgi:hypothetical protein
MKTCGRFGVEPHILNSVLDGGEWSASRPGRFASGEHLPIPSREDAGWILEPVWTLCRRENSVVQLIGRRYTGSHKDFLNLFEKKTCSLYTVDVNQD